MDIFRAKKTTCSENDLHPMSELASQQPEQGESYGARNLADLILSRGGIYDSHLRHLDNLYICTKHLTEMGNGWARISTNRPIKVAGGGRKLKCAMPKDLDGPGTDHGVIAARPRQYLTKENSEAIWFMRNIIAAAGTAMCRKHDEFANTLVEAMKAKHQQLQTHPDQEEGSSQQSLGNPAANLVGGHFLRQQGQINYGGSPQGSLQWRNAGSSPNVCSPRTPQSSNSNKRPHPESGGSYQPSDISQGALSQEPPGKKQKCDQVKEGVRFIAAALGIPREKVMFATSFADLATRSKAARTLVALKVTNAVMSAFAPDVPSELLEAAIEKRAGTWSYKKKSAKFIEWIKNVVEEYTMAPTRQIRLQILGTIAPIMHYTELEKYIPGLTWYAYKEARRRAAMLKDGYKEPPTSTTKERYNRAKVEMFISFITSPMVANDMPFGHIRIRRSTGEYEDLPNLIRITINKRIIELYKMYLKDTTKEHMVLSDSTMWRILKQCKATTRKSMLGLDYFTYNGVEGVSNLIALVDQIKQMDGDVDWASVVTRAMGNVKTFLRTDYKVYIQQHSDFADYSRAYALSDPNDKALQDANPGRHEQMRRCAMCIEMINAFKEIENKISNIAWPNPNDKTEAEFVFEKATEGIREWQKHVVRTANQAEAKDEILSTLDDNSAWILMDWAMKYLPSKGTESTSEWFGKRGISWHISVVFIRTSATDSYKMRTFAHVFDPVAQDSDAVLAIIQDVTERLKTELPNLEKVYLRSDNAVCYHSGPTLVSIPEISTQTGIKIVRYDFSDPQSGKGACDRATSIIKRHVKIHVNANNKCSTPAEFLTCIGSHRGVSSVTAVHAGLETATANAGKGSITGVTNLHNFEFTDAGIQAWNAYKIGPGKMVTATKRTVPLPKLHPIHSAMTGGQQHAHPLRHCDHWAMLSGTSVPECHQPVASAPTDDGWVSEDPDDFSHEAVRSGGSQAAITGNAERKCLYYCEEEGCTKVFQTYYQYGRHRAIGKHTYHKERQSLRDFSIDTYVKKIESSQVFSNLPTIAAAIRSQRDAETEDLNGIDQLPMGWALKVRRETKRFTSVQKAYLTEKFNEGAQTGIKYNPHDIAKNMRKDPRFPAKDSWLTWTQIAAYWSRLSHQHERSPTGHIATIDSTEAYDLEELDSNEYANAYEEHIIDSIESVVRNVMDMRDN